MYNLHIYEREDLTPIRKLLLMKAIAGGAATSEYTETGNPVEFNTNIAKALGIVAAFSPVQAGSGDPSPDNVRPITGFTGANVYLSPTDSDDPAKQTFAVTFPALGKNLFDVSTVESGTLDGYGNKVANASRTLSGFITMKAGTYTISRKAATDWWKIWEYTLAEEPLKAIMNNLNQSHTITLSEDCKIRIAFDYIVDAANEVQLESGSPATSYEPYNATAYGGTRDLSTGVLTVDRAEVDLGTLDYSLYPPQYTNIPVFYTDVNTIKPASGRLCKSSAYKCMDWSSLGTRTDNTIEVHPTLQSIYIADSRYETATEFKLAMSGVQLVYELATPLVYQLTPTEILSLVGDNVLWSDLNGDLTVTYKKKG